MTKTIKLEKDQRVLFLTKDLDLINKQLHEGLNLKMTDLSPHDLLDDINTDVMTPAWVCFHHDPVEIAKRAYAGLMYKNARLFQDGDLMNGQFSAIVSGQRKGTGSSRETAAQCEKFSGINLIFAGSFAPIHRRNNINLGQIMGDYDLLIRLQKGEEILFEEFLAPFDDFSKQILRAGGLFQFLRSKTNESPQISQLIKSKKPMNMAQKIMAKKILGTDLEPIFNQQSFIAQVDAGYSHEFTSAQVHRFLLEEFGPEYQIKNPSNFAAFEDHLIYADEVTKFKPFTPLIRELRDQQKVFIKHTKIRDYSAKNGISVGICHEVAREEFILPSDFIQATDSHTCMGGALNSFAFGVGSTEYAALLATGLAVVNIPASIRFELKAKLGKNCTAKDIILYILLNFSKIGLTLDKIMEFGGDGLFSLNLDERATLCNMATECGAKTGICEPDDKLIAWIKKMRPQISTSKLESLLNKPDLGCSYEGGYHEIDLALIKPMVAHPGNPDLGIPSDPTNGELVSALKDIPIDIAYGGSCTAGKFADIEMYARVCKQALKDNKSIKPGVTFYIQYGSASVAKYSVEQGFHNIFLQAKVKIIPPGCGACIGCGPGVSENTEQVSISAINRNFQGRSGPGKLYLASPLTVAASAFAGKIVAWDG